MTPCKISVDKVETVENIDFGMYIYIRNVGSDIYIHPKRRLMHVHMHPKQRRIGYIYTSETLIPACTYASETSIPTYWHIKNIRNAQVFPVPNNMHNTFSWPWNAWICHRGNRNSFLFQKRGNRNGVSVLKPVFKTVS